MSSILQMGKLRLGRGCSSLPRPDGLWVAETALIPVCGAQTLTKSFPARKGQSLEERRVCPASTPSSPAVCVSQHLLCAGGGVSPRNAWGLWLHHSGGGVSCPRTCTGSPVWFVPGASPGLCGSTSLALPGLAEWPPRGLEGLAMPGFPGLGSKGAF